MIPACANPLLLRQQSAGSGSQTTLTIGYTASPQQRGYSQSGIGSLTPMITVGGAVIYQILYSLFDYSTFITFYGNADIPGWKSVTIDGVTYDKAQFSRSIGSGYVSYSIFGDVFNGRNSGTVPVTFNN